MTLVLAILYAIFAGIINGSFALPTKRTKHWQFEHIWFNYAIWAFLIIPWGFIFFLEPNIWNIYQQTPTHSLLILCLGGLLFGIGQICFASALNMIGLGLGFVLNIGLSASLGFLAPLVLLHPDKLWTPFGISTLIGCGLIIIGLIISYQAGHARDMQKRQNEMEQLEKTYHYQLGVILAIIAGLFSAGQNVTFAATHNMQVLALNQDVGQLAASIIIWPIFLSFTFIPYAIYMISLHVKKQSLHLYLHRRSFYNTFLALVMGFFWFGSLIFYSKSSLLIGAIGPIVAWPLFMVCIILTSNFWGWREQEWVGCSTKIIHKIITAIILLIIAVLILAYSVTLTQ